LQNSPLESSCVVVALAENYSTSKPLKVSPEESHILSCDTVVANERYGRKLKTTHDVAGRWPATSRVHYTTSCNTQSSTPEDGQNNCPKLIVELNGIINKPLLLHLVGCLYYLYRLCTVKQILNSDIL